MDLLESHFAMVARICRVHQAAKFYFPFGMCILKCTGNFFFFFDFYIEFYEIFYLDRFWRQFLDSCLIYVFNNQF